MKVFFEYLAIAVFAVLLAEIVLAGWDRQADIDETQNRVKCCKLTEKVIKMSQNNPTNKEEFVTSEEFEERRQKLGIRSIPLRMAMWSVLQGQSINGTARQLNVDAGQLSKAMKLYREGVCTKCGRPL